MKLIKIGNRYINPEKISEALASLIKSINDFVDRVDYYGIDSYYRDCYDKHKETLSQEIGKAQAALAAPPRNCDAMDWRTAWKIWREKFHPETPVGYSAVVKGTEAFMDWFTAPATEQEGGAKC